MSDFTNELLRLSEMRDKGLISQEEFDIAKAKLFGSPQPPSIDSASPPEIPAAPTAVMSVLPPAIPKGPPVFVEPAADPPVEPASAAVSDEIPPGIKGWSWGAFLWNWIWAIFNNTWIGLLALIPGVNLVMVFVLGAKGREWAWKNKQWESVEHFNRVQRKWSLWGIWLILGSLALGLLLMVASFIFMGMAGSKMSGVEPAIPGDTPVVSDSNDVSSNAQIGQTIATNYFEFTVNNVTETSSIRPDAFTDQQAGAGNKYVILDITMKNTDTEGRMFSEGELVAVHNGQELTFDNTETILADGYLIFETLNPLTTVTGKIVYKVPEELTGDFYWVPGRDSKRILLRMPSSVEALPALAPDTVPVENAAPALEADSPERVEPAIAEDTTTEDTTTEDDRLRSEELAKTRAEAAAAKAEAAKAKKEALKAEKALAEQKRREREEQDRIAQEQAEQEQMQCQYSKAQPLTCSSRKGQPTQCDWNFRACGNPRVAKKESKTSCEGKVSWDTGNNQLIVTDGCRAQFVPTQ